MIIGKPHRIASTTATPFEPHDLRISGLAESDLESIIAANPALVGLTEKARGTSWVARTQCTLGRPGKSDIYPDIIFVSEHGDIAIVEVKLQDNSELDNRAVIAQAVEYTACLRRASQADLARILASGLPPIRSRGPGLEHLLAALFPGTSDIPTLASQIARRLAQAEIQIIIAADGIPAGLRETVDDVCRVAAGAFSVEVIELKFFRDGGVVICVPVGRIQTQVVQQIQVVTTAAGIEVKATPLEEVEANRAGGVGKRQWNWDSFSAKLQEEAGPQAVAGAKRLVDWAEAEAEGVDWGFNQTGTFIPEFLPGTAPYPFRASTSGRLRFQFENMAFRGPFAGQNFKEGLLAVANKELQLGWTDEVLDRKPAIRLETLANQNGWESFLRILEWIQNQVSAPETWQNQDA